MMIRTFDVWNIEKYDSRNSNYIYDFIIMYGWYLERIYVLYTITVWHVWVLAKLSRLYCGRCSQNRLKFSSPYFDSGVIRYWLRCFQVSWIRHRDLHILTVGKYLFTTDERFQALHKDGSDEWILFVKYAQIRDSGIYECQISTQPVRSVFVNLNVVGKRACLALFIHRYDICS